MFSKPPKAVVATARPPDSAEPQPGVHGPSLLDTGENSNAQRFRAINTPLDDAVDSEEK